MSGGAPRRAPRAVVAAAAARLGRRNLVLVGLMGVGKTATGRALARRLGRELVDTDALVVAAAAGQAIPAIFAAEGEAGFRRREAAVVASVMAREGLIVATGGGAVLLPENRAALRRGVVVWLQAPPAELLRRAGGHRAGQSRPLLNASDPLGRLEALMRERKPLYGAVAHLRLDTRGRSTAHVAAALLAALSQLAPEPEEIQA